MSTKPKTCAHCGHDLTGATFYTIQGIDVCAAIRDCLARQAERAQLHPEFGLRIDYVSTLREERPAGNNLADAQTARDRTAERPDVVSCTVIGWLAGKWHEIGDDRG